MDPLTGNLMQNDPSYIIYGTGLSFVFYMFVLKLVSPRVSKVLWPRYSSLPYHDKAEWDNRFISNISAIACSIVGVYILHFDEVLHKDKLFHDSSLARYTCAVLIGYQMADTLCIVFWCRYSRGLYMGFLLHHVVTIYAYYYVSCFGVFCYFAMLRLLSEISTPFVNQRWFFEILGHSTREFLVIQNGLAMFFSFLFFRILPIPVYWGYVFSVRSLPGYDVIGSLQLILFVPALVLDTLNVYWFYKIARGIMKVLFQQRHTKLTYQKKLTKLHINSN